MIEIVNSALAVSGRVLMLFIMIGIGYVVAKNGIITKRGSAQLSEFLLTVVTPFVIINAFAGAGGDGNYKNMLHITIIAFVYHFIAIGISMLTFRKESDDKKKVLRYCIVFSNCGYMGLPMVRAVLDENAVIYASIFIAIFHFFSWTFGVLLMGGKDGKVSIRKALINPGTIGIAIGLPIMLLNIQIPTPIAGAVDSFAQLNTPIAMLIIGGNLARIKLWEAFKQKSAYIGTFFSLVLIPLVCIPVLCLIGCDQTIFTVAMIQISAPVAAASVLFANKFKRDSTIASQTMAISTMFSIITMPIFILIAQNINGII